IILEVAAEPPVIALAETRLLGIGRAVEIRDRVALPADDEAHRVPRQVNGPLLRLRVPVARVAELALAVGAQIVRLLRRLLGDLVRRAELKAGVLRIAVEPALAAGR